MIGICTCNLKCAKLSKLAKFHHKTFILEITENSLDSCNGYNYIEIIMFKIHIKSSTGIGGAYQLVNPLLFNGISQNAPTQPSPSLPPSLPPSLL